MNTLPKPSPAPWTFADSMYGIGNCLIDRDGRVIGAHLPIGNGPLIAQAPAMAELLRALVCGEETTKLRAAISDPSRNRSTRQAGAGRGRRVNRCAQANGLSLPPQNQHRAQASAER